MSLIKEILALEVYPALGRTVEDSIRNLGRITLEGMFQVDPTVLDILQGKARGPGNA